MSLYLILASTTNGKILKSHTKRINVKYQLHSGIKNLNNQIDHTVHQIFMMISSIS